MEYVALVLRELLEIPSPSGRTDHVTQYVGERLDGLGLPSVLTRRGTIKSTLEGRRSQATRAVVVHTDTIGCMVRTLKENGRLEVKPVGTHSARFAEGAHVRIFTDDLDTVITGQVLPLKASGHRYNDDVDLQGVGWELVEVRVDEAVTDVAGLRALGIDVGDFVAMVSEPQLLPSGYVKARHLDDKAGVAAVLGAFKAVVDAGIRVPVTAHLLVTPAPRRSGTARATAWTPRSPRSSPWTPPSSRPGSSRARTPRRSRWATASGRSTTT
jgi:putative aminopeptidase FrvX